LQDALGISDFINRELDFAPVFFQKFGKSRARFVVGKIVADYDHIFILS